ncbi:MAG: chromosome segregation protein SMC [Candidatus Marinimicrobia bacterium]|nr:chromosome segregation protein SMC [Candidatus Neomarinimicrobiota bacterium]MDP7165507.1 chromosome segregation protein SMC [Candidatus Neomarinimicrobiota bacterium]
MYISDLNIHGFKSFAKKDNLKFGEGITAIVGPNGCGKTNIVDAIRWVLGEQKYSVLRSGKMEDVIFSGADTAKPLSVCDVSLTVHNNKGKLPLEYNDVEIGRRIFRNGDSEYFINRTPCRLKDIQDLFIDTGMGADAYSVIELKMIEQILSETTDDRKRMFEEAAGINKYKHQRKSALRKFEAVRTDLERVQDIIAEVEAKVKALALQLKRFERHEKLSDELQQREIALAFIKIKEFEEAATPLRKKIQDFKHLRESTATETSIHEKELDQLKSVYQQQQNELDEMRTDISTAEETRDTLQRDVLVASEQRRSAESTVERLDREKTANENRVVQLKQHIDDYDEEAKKLLPQIDLQLAVYKKEKANFESIDKKYKEAQSTVDALQNKRWDEQRKLADQESLFKRTEDMLGDKEVHLEDLKTREKSLKQTITVSEKEFKEKEKKLTTLQQQVEQTLEKLEKVKSHIQSLKLDEHEAVRTQHSLDAKEEGLQNQIQFYENLLESKEGFTGGVKYVLNHSKDFPGVHGVLAELLDVDKEYQAIIENVLGSTAGCLVSKDRATALKTLQILKSQKHGSASILPLKELSVLNSKIKSMPKSDHIVTRALDSIKADKKYTALVNVLLGNVLIVNDLSKALQDSKLAGWDLVDLEGTFSGTNMILKQGKKGKGLVGRQEKLDALKQQLQENKKTQSSVQNDVKEIAERLTNFMSEQSNIEATIDNLKDDVSVLENDGLQYKVRNEQHLELLNTLSDDMDETSAAITSLKASLKKLSPTAEKGDKILAKVADELTNANNVLMAVRKQRDEFHQHVQDLRIEVLNLENQRDNIVFQKRTADDSVTELSGRQNEIGSEIKSLQEKQKELDNKIKSCEKDLQKANAVVSKKRSILDLKKETYQETYGEIEIIQAKIREEQHSRENLLDELKSAELDVTDFDQKIKLVIERIKDRYNTSIPKSMNVKESLFALEERIEKINRSIENIGPINMAVKDEHEVETERLELLTDQKADLIESEENLRETIQKIDQEARKLFTETFDQIKINFEKLFSMFFEGGKGSLSLVGDPDPLEADIAINAQPPGKKNNSLRMLSAGEKSLTAIALLFSIYQYKPSPYCILDEVDAPLDDVNIRKFTKVLEAFSEETQFIVVTHNKLTMEAANYLFGVTMEQKGVSKLVSVKFDA